MATALIVEDEPHIHAQLGALLAELWPALKIVATAEDDVAALAAFREHEPDVLFLDVKMPGLSGVEVLQAAGLCTQLYGYATVFITAFDDFAVTTFDVGAVDYIVKPITAARLAKAITRVQEKLLLGEGASAALPAVSRAVAVQVPPLRWAQATLWRPSVFCHHQRGVVLSIKQRIHPLGHPVARSFHPQIGQVAD